MNRWGVSQQLNFAKFKVVGARDHLNRILRDMTTGIFSEFSNPSIIEAIKETVYLTEWIIDRWHKVEEAKVAYFRSIGELTDKEVEQEVEGGM